MAANKKPAKKAAKKTARKRKPRGAKTTPRRKATRTKAMRRAGMNCERCANRLDADGRCAIHGAEIGAI